MYAWEKQLAVLRCDLAGKLQFIILSGVSQGLGSTDDFEKFLRNGSLTGFIVGALESPD
jgi:hypothetical protein